MGQLSRTVKDRKCIVCGESRQRDANTLKAHSVKCLSALRAHVKGGGTLDDFLASDEYKAIRGA